VFGTDCRNGNYFGKSGACATNTGLTIRG